MNIKKCEKGHFYNGDKYKTCPHCEEKQQNNKAETNAQAPARGYQINNEMPETVAYVPPAQTGKGASLSQAFNGNTPIPEAGGVYAAPEQPATPAYEKPVQQINSPAFVHQNGLPAGWLVAVSGLSYGRQYPIFTCDNYIGSGPDNSICVEGDMYVMPEHHCTLSFDMQTQKIVLNISASTGEVYLNNNPVRENQYIGHMDKIQIGGSVYMLVELCRDGFSWWKTPEKKPEESAMIYDIDTAFDETAEISGMNFDDCLGSGETTVLSAMPWRCTACNGLNPDFEYVCRFCGTDRG